MSEQNDEAGQPLSSKSGYYYAHNTVSPEGPKTLVGATEIYAHKALDANEIKRIERENSASADGGASAWNKGGTWEEKDFSKWAEGRIKELLPAIETPGKLIGFSEPSSIDECHATVVISRGKKKPLCEVEKIKVPWTSADGNAKGKLEITDVSTADLDDLCVSFTFDKSVEAAQKPALEKELKACKQRFETAFETLLAEMNLK
mmetsp:Transcript_20140/g.29539  ORF Transcript_20140/g.29539 Transcript_20140/m.29539 type:complete len:204 (+) Transcript_20140:29-640(+)